MNAPNGADWPHRIKAGGSVRTPFYLALPLLPSTLGIMLSVQVQP